MSWKMVPGAAKPSAIRHRITPAQYGSRSTWSYIHQRFSNDFFRNGNMFQFLRPERIPLHAPDWGQQDIWILHINHCHCRHASEATAMTKINVLEAVTLIARVPTPAPQRSKPTLCDEPGLTAAPQKQGHLYKTGKCHEHSTCHMQSNYLAMVWKQFPESPLVHASRHIQSPTRRESWARAARFKLTNAASDSLTYQINKFQTMGGPQRSNWNQLLINLLRIKNDIPRLDQLG